MKAYLGLALHFHQPVGNFDHVIERACDKCYLPFLQTMKKYPGLKVNLHFTGCLLEWAEGKRPELLEIIREMSLSGQAEILSGGFYEPILISIPPEDRVEQINMLTRYVFEKFSTRPKGAWIAERIWEPSMPSIFYDAGIKYAILDDTHFIYAGLVKDQTYGYYVTEDNVKSVSIFPSDKVLRYYVPFKMPNECADYMKGVAQRMNEPLFVYGDDGEKFGEWPGTHKWVYEEKWLLKFLDELMNNGEWLETVKLSEYMEKHPPKGNVYLPTSSYEEMLEWSLPADAQEKFEDVIKEIGKEERFKPFLRGGFWRNFFSKYPESNQMNKKMIYVSEKLKKAADAGKSDVLVRKATKELFRGQCNCAYWHGVFGGLYLFHLRRAVYHHLLRSEVLIDEAMHGKKHFHEAHTADFDADGLDEIILENREISLFVDPADGGTIKEIDSKSACFNLTNTLSRKKEAYHRKVREKACQNPENQGKNARTIHDDIQSVDAKILEYLYYDRYTRSALVDHFLKKGTDLGTFFRNEYDEVSDFTKGAYGFKVLRSGKDIVLSMAREGTVNGAGVEVRKEITIPQKGDIFSVKYVIKNTGKNTLETLFGTEINIAMPDADSEKYSLSFGAGSKKYGLNDTADVRGVKTASIDDASGVLSFGVELSENVNIWHFPVKTVSHSERAFELNYQGALIFPYFEVAIKPFAEKEFRVEFGLGSGK